jgi:hypothetical protein
MVFIPKNESGKSKRGFSYVFGRYFILWGNIKGKVLKAFSFIFIPALLLEALMED